MTMLIDRQVLILQSIVENFITTNQPVGSKQIAQNIDFSSATIRNDMSKLEKEGLIKRLIFHQVEYLRKKVIAIM